MRLHDKVALITGAAAGILAREGARVVLADRNAEQAADVAAALGTSAHTVVADVSDGAEVKAMVRSAVGRLDILVNNAGYGIPGTVVITEKGARDAFMAVNLKGVVLCCKHAIPVMAAQGGGTIVDAAANVATEGILDRAAYVASRGANAILWLASDEASFATGAPFTIDGGMTAW